MNKPKKNLYISNSKVLEKIENRNPVLYPKAIDYVNAAILNFNEESNKILTEEKFMEEINVLKKMLEKEDSKDILDPTMLWR